MKLIKKLLGIALAMALLFLLPAALAEDEASSYAGIWIEADGYGTLTVYSDGSASMLYYDGTVADFEWGITDGYAKCITGPWADSSMELKDENTLHVCGDWLIFNREGTQPTVEDLNAVPVGEEGAPFFGTWTLDSISFDGTTFKAADFGMSMTLVFNSDGTVVSTEDGVSNTAVWRVESGAVVADDLTLTLNADQQLVLEEDGASMIFIQGETAGESELTEAEQLAALLAMMSQVSEETSDLPEELQGYVGQWYMVYTATGGLTGDLRTMGVNCTLTLYSDGTGSIDFPTAEESTWYDDEGIVRFGESGMPMTLLEDGFLQYGSLMGGYMIFSQDSTAVFDPAILEASAAPAATQEPAAAATRTFTSNEEYLNVRFVATTYSMMGQTYDAATLGVEYSLLFRADGTCDLGLAGTVLPNLSWGLGKVAVGLNQIEAFSINYYGTTFNAVPTATGFDMDYYGTMTLHFTPAE